MDDIPRNLFVNVRWTDSNLLIAVTEHRLLRAIGDSGCVRAEES